MAESRARDLVAMGDSMFAAKRPVDALWQEYALQFYTERSDFTGPRVEGAERATHLVTSRTEKNRQRLANLFGVILRPQSPRWFGIHVTDERLDKGKEERQFLDYLTGVQWRAMYDPAAQFIRSAREADHDFVTFGNAAIKVGPNIAGNGLLYSCYHLRDTAWSENAEGRVDCLHRNWNPTARQLKQFFESTMSKDALALCADKPEERVKCRHVVMPSRAYDYKSKHGKKYPFVSLWIECETETVLEEVGQNYFGYVVPRWQTVSGSPWGISMATSISLPDARTYQAIVRTMREAGEKFVDPPMLGQENVFRSDIALYPGGITMIDQEYDETKGEALRPVSQDKGGMPIGFEIAQTLREDIDFNFFLDQIQLPDLNGKMTAYEVRARIEQHRRNAAPIFEPIETDYSTPLCEQTFEVLRDGKAFGPIEKMMPETLANTELKFTFKTPMTDLDEQMAAEIYRAVLADIILPAAQIDRAQLSNLQLTTAVRDAMRSVGTPPEWFAPETAVEQARANLAEMAAQQTQMAEAEGVANVADVGSRAVKTISEAA